MIVPLVEIIPDVDSIKTCPGYVEILSDSRVLNANIDLGIAAVRDYAVCA